MANIKFSAFTQKVALGDVDFLVGYTGADNVRVAPSVFSGIYLPLAGGTMTGVAGVNVPDNFKWNFGNAPDFEIYHNSTTNANYINSLLGRQLLINTDNLWIGNGAGTESMIRGYDAGTVELYYDNVKKFETTTDGVTVTGDLLVNTTGGYFQVDASENKVNFADETTARFGAGGDMEIYHGAVGPQNYIKIHVGDLYIRNEDAGQQIYIQATDGGGTTSNYLTIDGNLEYTKVSKDIRFEDNVQLELGTGRELTIYSDGSNGLITNQIGDLYITNSADNEDIIFRCDDGSGGIETYFYLDGSLADGTYNYTRWNDGGVITFGDGQDLRIWHDPSNSCAYMRNYTNDLYIENTADDKDIIFKNDDGSGGTTTYFRLDGSAGGALPFTVFPDNSNLTFGDGYDLRQYHNGSNSYLDNYEGDLIIRNYADDKDIHFSCDDGSGGTTLYYYLDGSRVINRFPKNVYLEDNVKLLFGDVGTPDLEIYHDGSNSYISDTGTGDLVIKASNNMFFESAAGASKIIARTGGALDLYHNGSKKIETTSTGTLTTGQMDIAALNTAPASAGAAGTLGEIRYTADYIYVCTATNTWKRAALSTW